MVGKTHTVEFDVVASVRCTIFTREVPAPVFAFASKVVAKIFVPHFGCSINGDLVLNVDLPWASARRYLTYLNRIKTLITTT